jgi:hypothetical protein
METLAGTHRQQGDLINLLTKIRGGYTDSKVISYASFYFQNKECKLARRDFNIMFCNG